MFYCKSGHNKATNKHELIWVCDNEDILSICIASPLKTDNDFTTNINGQPISSLQEIQKYFDSCNYIWDEPAWDVYNEQLEYIESIESLI